MIMHKKFFLTTVILSLLAFTSIYAQNSNDEVKKVAILETVDREDKIGYGVELMIRSSLAYAITSTPGYEGFDRVNIESILGEHNFQRTGMVNDEQIKKLGEMTGAAYILVAEVAKIDDQNIFITATILNVENAKLEQTSNVQSKTEAQEIGMKCTELAHKLFQNKNTHTQYTKQNNKGNQQKSNNNRETNRYNSQQNEVENLSTPINNFVNSITKNVHNDNSTNIVREFTETANNVNIEMVLVEGSTFKMGNKESNETNEQKEHHATVTSFYMGKYEITQEQWEKIMNTDIELQKELCGESRDSSIGPNKPMYCISWEEAVEFCNRLSILTGKTYRLPTEAEWEYAARGGKLNDTRLSEDLPPYSGSRDIQLVCWYGGNSSCVQDVGLKNPNLLGLYDMSGNVYEWCLDWYANYTTPFGGKYNYQGPNKGDFKVLRGGSFNNTPNECRITYRNYNKPTARNLVYGFRVVMEI